MKKDTKKISGSKKYIAWLLGIAFIFLVIWIGKILPNPQTNQNKEAPAPNELRVLPPPNEPADALSLVVEPDDHMQTVFQLIKSAQSSIDLVMYEFNDPDIANALADAESRSVSVRVLLNKGYDGATDPAQAATMKLLKSKNISVRYTPQFFALTHQKTMVVDDQKAFIMTFNFTKKYYTTSRDFGIVDNDQNDVSAIKQTFDADWNGKKVASNNGDNLVWSPGAETAMLLIIERAQRTIDVYNEEMADDTITQALIAAAGRGVVVRVDMSYSTVYKPAFGELVQGGVQVRTYASGSKKRYIHAKMIIVDNDYAFIGSQNFSWYSLEKNRELGIFISDPSTIASLEKIFQNDWNEARIFTVKK